MGQLPLGELPKIFIDLRYRNQNRRSKIIWHDETGTTRTIIRLISTEHCVRAAVGLLVSECNRLILSNILGIPSILLLIPSKLETSEYLKD